MCADEYRRIQKLYIANFMLNNYQTNLKYMIIGGSQNVNLIDTGKLGSCMVEGRINVRNLI